MRIAIFAALIAVAIIMPIVIFGQPPEKEWNPPPPPPPTDPHWESILDTQSGHIYKLEETYFLWLVGFNNTTGEIKNDIGNFSLIIYRTDTCPCQRYTKATVESIGEYTATDNITYEIIATAPDGLHKVTWTDNASQSFNTEITIPPFESRIGEANLTVQISYRAIAVMQDYDSVQFQVHAAGRIYGVTVMRVPFDYSD